MLLGSVVFLSSCLKKTEFPAEPAITFKSFAASGDEAVLEISFTDGDGNIGLNEGDTLAPYEFEGDFYFNLTLEYQEKQNGVWVTRDLDPPFKYRVPVITPTGQNKALEGDIRVDITPFYYDPFSAFDTIRYEIQLTDRALNRSNKVMSEEIITP